RRGGGLGNRTIHGRNTKAAINLTQVNRWIRPVRWTGQTGQTGARDRSDWLACSTPCTRSHPTAEVLSSKRSLLRDAAVLMKIQSAVLEGLRNPGRWPVLRKPPKPHAREDSLLHAVALDAARRPSPPRPQRGPRRRRRPSPPSVPRPTPVPPRLGVFNRRPPPWFC